MKKGIAILLTFAYLLLALKPVLPYLFYEVNKEKITAMFCINREFKEKECEGKCYLKKELHKNTEESKKTTTTFSESETAFSILPPFISISFKSNYQTTQHLNFLTTLFFKSSYLFDIFHPPAVV